MLIRQNLEKEIQHYVLYGHRIKKNKQDDCEICIKKYRKEPARFIYGGDNTTDKPKIRCTNCNSLNNEDNVCAIFFGVYWCADCISNFDREEVRNVAD